MKDPSLEPNCVCVSGVDVKMEFHKNRVKRQKIMN